MARLTIEQVKAPDFSASSEMLARANQSFNTGIDSAKGILDKYNTGQQAKGDQALVGALAGLKSEDELANFLQTTDLSQMNISDTMRQNILTARESILGNNATRQSTTNAADANSRANAGEGRVAAEYADNVAARDELRALTPAYVGALAEGQTYGRGPNTNQDWLSYDNQGATRNDPLSPELVQSMSFLGDMGVTMRVTSGGQENNTDQGTGSTRHNHGNAADADFYIGDRKLDWNNPQDLPIFQQIVTQARANGVTGIGAGDDYMGAGRMHVGFGNPGVWGADGQGANAPDWLTAAYNGAPAGTAPITRNGIGGEAAAAFTAALQAGTRMTPDQAAALFNSVLGQQTAGQTLIDAAEAKRQTDVIAAGHVANLNDPNINSPAGMAAAGLNTQGISATNQLLAAEQGEALALKFPELVAPGPTAAEQLNTELVSIALGQTSAAEDEARRFTTAAANQRVLEKFKTDDPVGTLFEIADFSGDWGISEEYSRETIQQLADQAGVGLPEMVATMGDLVDPDDPTSKGQSLRWMLADTGYHGKIVEEASKRYGPESKAESNAYELQSKRAKGEREIAQLQLAEATSRIKQYPPGSPERVKAQAEIDSMKDTMLKGITPQERTKMVMDYATKQGFGSRLKGLKPDSPEFINALAQLEQLVEQDFKNGTLTAKEKDLLISGIRG